MVTKRKSPVKARTRTVYRAAPRKRSTRRKAPQYANIPAAAATVALVAVNAQNIKNTANAITNAGRDPMSKWPTRAVQGITGKNKWINGSYKSFISGEQLLKDAVAVAGGMIGGELVRKYAPTIVKQPIAKIAKKIPKVF